MKQTLKMSEAGIYFPLLEKHEEIKAREREKSSDLVIAQ